MLVAEKIARPVQARRLRLQSSYDEIPIMYSLAYICAGKWSSLKASSGHVSRGINICSQLVATAGRCGVPRAGVLLFFVATTVT